MVQIYPTIIPPSAEDDIGKYMTIVIIRLAEDLSITGMGKTAIFPAAGKLGTALYESFLKLQSPTDVVLISRNPSKIPQYHKDAGVECRTADYDDPPSLSGIFRGVDTLVLISYPSIQIEHRFEAHKRAIEAALSDGVKYVFYTSLAFGGDGSMESKAYVMQAHLKTEEYLATSSREKGFSYTSMREGIYSESWPLYLSYINFQDAGKKTMRIPSSGQTGGISWIKISELGEATASLVTSYLKSVAQKKDFPYQNRVIVLGGSKSYTLAETARILARQHGVELDIEEVSLDEYTNQESVQKGMGTYGGSTEIVRQWATMYEAVELGECAVQNTLIEELLGHPAEDFETSVQWGRVQTYV